jgi:L-lactate permease
MTPRNEGAIVMISSTAAIGAFGALGTPLTYGVAEAPMNHLTKELARMVGFKPAFTHGVVDMTAFTLPEPSAGSQ